MSFKHIYILIFCIYSISFVSHAQHYKKPKVGLVLSGGGAKGLAHIGVLKVLEENGIKPDYITGTSMGAIVGGLYAIGYSVSDIERIAHENDWAKILSNSVSNEYIIVPEKNDCNRSIFNLTFDNRGIHFPKGLIESQTLQQRLSYLTFPVHDVTNFLKFPIPFACIATDVSTGKAVVIKSGNLATAMRASMSIPTVFTPVEIDGKLLIDGGMVRNFPVEEVIEMGADIVIGVNLDEGLIDYKELSSAVDILFQSSFFMSSFDTQIQKKKCKLLIEPNLTPYSTGSFFDVDSVIARGEFAARQKQTEIAAFAKKIRTEKILVNQDSSASDTIEHVSLYSLMKKDSVLIDSIIIEGNKIVCNETILSRLGIKLHRKYSKDEINNKIFTVYGISYFKTIGYEFEKSETSNGSYLVLHISENPKGTLGFALRFDNENKAGFNLNLILHDFITHTSRLKFEFDIAENPRLALNYIEFLNKSLRFYSKIGVRGESFGVQTSEGTQISSYLQTSKNRAYASLNYNFLINTLLGVEIARTWSYIKPQIATGVYTGVNNIQHKGNDVAAFFTINSLDNTYYPKKGQSLNLRYAIFFNVFNDGNFSSTSSDSTFLKRLNISHMYKQFTFNYIKYISLVNKKITIAPQLDILSSDRDNVGIVDQWFVGGFNPIFYNTHRFYGVSQFAYPLQNATYANFMFRIEPIRNIYIRLNANFITSRYPGVWYNKLTTTAKSIDQLDHNIGYHADISYDSFIGPLGIGFAGNSNFNGILFNFFFGYRFRQE